MFLDNIREWGKKLTRGVKAKWDEAVCPANVVPFNFSSVSAKNFVAAFGHKEYTAKELHSALNCRRFPSLTKQAIDDEFGARQNFLGCLNASITAKAVPRQQGQDADTKLSLWLPFWTLNSHTKGLAILVGEGGPLTGGGNSIEADRLEILNVVVGAITTKIRTRTTISNLII